MTVVLRSTAMTPEPTPSRHGDVLVAIWCVVGVAMILTLALLSPLQDNTDALGAVGAAGAAVGVWLARQARPGLRPSEAVVAALIAAILLPGVARFGQFAFDVAAARTAAIAGGIGGAAAWLVARAPVRPVRSLGVWVAAAMMSAAFGLSIVSVLALRPTTSVEMTIRVVLVACGGLAGAVMGRLVPATRAPHALLGAAIAMGVPFVFQFVGALRWVPLRYVVEWGALLAIGGGLGWTAGRHRAAAAAAPSPIPPARTVD